MGRLSKARKRARNDFTRPSVTFYHRVTGRVVPANTTGTIHMELFGAHTGTLTPDGKELHKTIKFPDMETAITYVVETKLGYKVEKPNFGHWIDSSYWTPLCINPAPMEIKDG